MYFILQNPSKKVLLRLSTEKYKCLSNERRRNSETNCVGPILKFHLWPEKFKKNCLQLEIHQFSLAGTGTQYKVRGGSQCDIA